MTKGWNWEENIPGTLGKETIKSEDIPDKIEDVSENFLKEIFACSLCLLLDEFKARINSLHSSQDFKQMQMISYI